MLVCKVVYLSGAADYIELVFREMERPDMLAEDRTSAELLTGALLCFGASRPAFVL
jgi:hypothetical protein